MKKISIVMLFSNVLLTTAIVQAQPMQDVRCNTDSLSVAQAKARLEWARRCALQLVGTASVFGDNVAFSTTNPNPEYAESASSSSHLTGSVMTAMNAATGVTVPYAINTSYAKNMYNTGVPHGSTSLVLSTGTFAIWNEDPLDTPKDRPTYPAFGTDRDGAMGYQLWPHEDPTINPSFHPGDCNLYTDRVGGTVSTVHYVTAYCQSSCYTPEQRILFAEDIDSESNSAAGGRRERNKSNGGRWERIIDAYDQMLPRVMTLTPDSTLDRFSLQPKDLLAYTIEFYDSNHEIFEIETARGGILRVTGEHPILRNDGRIVFAQDLQIHDKLIRLDGSFDPIFRIRKTNYFGKVYNLRPDSLDLLENVVAAQGFLVGSSQYQNDYVHYINQVLLSHALPTSILPGHTTSATR